MVNGTGLQRYYLLQRLKAVEPLLGLNVYAHVDEVGELGEYGYF